MSTTARQYTNIYGQKVVEYTQNGKTVGKGTGSSFDAAKGAADADLQTRNNKK